MADKKNEKNIWGYIGKAGVLVGLIWGSIQIYNNFFKADDYQAKAKGSHSFYETSPKHNQAFIKNAEYKALVRTIIEREGALKDYKLDTLLSQIKSTNSKDKIYFDLNLSREKPFSWGNDYTSIWKFSIKNNGNKPLEELVLELPFDGMYKVILPNNIEKTNDFKKRIEIGELRPSYEANIYCWTDDFRIYTEDDEEKSRFTHKNGWFSIAYPVEVTGIYAWNKRNNDTPLIIGIGILLFLFMLVYSIGESIGSKNSKEEIKEENLSDEIIEAKD